jgi:hypothetical protein
MEDPSDNGKEPQLAAQPAELPSRFSQIMPWVGVATSVATVVLSYVTFSFNAKHTGAEDSLKGKQETFIEKQDAFNEQVKTVESNLEVSKDRTTRLQFVKLLLPDLLQADIVKKGLTYNLIRLSLTDTESRQLFFNFSQSSDSRLKTAGANGLMFLNKERVASEDAKEYERYGFQCLIDGRYNDAWAYFVDAENADNGYHMAYEIARLIRLRRPDLDDPVKRKEVLSQIVGQYSLGAPLDLLNKLKALSVK